MKEKPKVYNENSFVLLSYVTLDNKPLSSDDIIFIFVSENNKQELRAKTKPKIIRNNLNVTTGVKSSITSSITSIIHMKKTSEIISSILLYKKEQNKVFNLYPLPKIVLKSGEMTPKEKISNLNFNSKPTITKKKSINIKSFELNTDNNFRQNLINNNVLELSNKCSLYAYVTCDNKLLSSNDIVGIIINNNLTGKGFIRNVNNKYMVVLDTYHDSINKNIDHILLYIKKTDKIIKLNNIPSIDLNKENNLNNILYFNF